MRQVNLWSMSRKIIKAVAPSFLRAAESQAQTEAWEQRLPTSLLLGREKDRLLAHPPQAKVVPRTASRPPAKGRGWLSVLYRSLQTPRSSLLPRSHDPQ